MKTKTLKKLKRFLAMVLVLTICVSSININAFAEISSNENEWDGISTQAVYETEEFKITYSLTGYWEGGYNANIKIDNTSDSIIENWYLGLKTENDISNVWNGKIETVEVGNYVIKNVVWNQDIEIGSSVEFGLSGNESFKGFPEEYKLLSTRTEVSEENYTIDYKLDSDWGDGFNATISITNNTDTVIEDWRLEFEYARNITGIWNANIESREDGKYNIKNAGYTSNIEAGQTISFGFCGNAGSYDDIIYNVKLYTYGINDVDNVKLVDGTIDKQYLERAIYPNLFLRDMSIDNIRLSDDYDNDGLSLEVEYIYDTNPFFYDSDEDGLSDYDEIEIYKTSPINSDTDEDNMSDGTEIACGLNPLLKDSDNNGIEDGYETITQEVRIDSIYNYSIDDVETLPSIQITGKGDYSKKLYAQPIENNKAILDIDCLVGTPFDFVHDEELEFENSTLSFTISDVVLKKYDLNELTIAHYDEENNRLELIETTYDIESNVISADVNHYSIYMVVSAIEYFYNIDLENTSNIIESGKADVVFVIDTTGSMGNEIQNVRENIDEFVAELEEKNVDVRLGLVEYKDIYADGVGSTKSYDWYTTVSSFKSQLSLLGITGGGDTPESVVDALSCARQMKYRNGVKKYIIVITDANYKNGTAIDAGATLTEEIQELNNEDIVVSVVTISKYYSTYKDLVDKTGGVSANINQNFAIALSPLITKMSEQINEGCWVRLSNGSLVCLDKNPSLGDDTVDTDGDGIPDVIELKTTYKSLQYNILKQTFEEVDVWMFSSNPIVEDTDGDTLSDVDDLDPDKFDTVVVEEDDDYIKFNTGKTWDIIDCTAYDYFDNGLQIVDYHVDNPMSAEEFQSVYKNVSKNEVQNYTVEELAYIGVVNNEGSKLYLNQKKASLREEVFQNITDRESKYYKHKGILWWEKWEETNNTQGGFFKGTVLSEADINFSCKLFTTTDVYTVLNSLAKAGALVLTLVLVTDVTPTVLANIQGLTYYVKTFGVRQGFDMYLLLGISNLPNGVISWIQMDTADGDTSLDDIIDNGIPIHERGITGEQAVAEMHPGESQKYFSTLVNGVEGGRYVDQFSDNIAYEAKVGYTCLSERIKMQILKDNYLLQSGQVDGVVWEFYKSEITGRIGASKPLLEMLDKYGIEYIYINMR